MLIRLTASGRPARLLEDQSAATRVAAGQFEVDCANGTTLQGLIETLGLGSVTLLCVVDDKPVGPADRKDLILDEGAQVAFVPPIRAG